MNLVRLRDILCAAKDDPMTRAYADKLLRIVEEHEAEVEPQEEKVYELFQGLSCPPPT